MKHLIVAGAVICGLLMLVGALYALWTSQKVGVGTKLMFSGMAGFIALLPLAAWEDFRA